MKTLGKIALSIAVFGSLSFFCDLQTKRLRVQEIFTDIPNDSQWEIPPLIKEEQERLHARLQQSFSYLGAGDQSIAFLGSDRKTVLKFFKHNHSVLEKILEKLSLPTSKKLFHQTIFSFKSYDPRPVFKSCMIAWQELREQTGLLYVHINKTKGQLGRVTLLDNCRVAHTVDLDSTEFLVQEYAELSCATIDAKIKKGDLVGAKRAIQALFSAVEEYSKQGIHISHPAIRRNFGFIGEKVVLLDIGSFHKEDSSKAESSPQKEIVEVTARLQRWLKKHHSELLPFFEQELTHALEVNR